MKNKKGFTLIELLVVIVIMGIVTGLSIPLLRNIRQSNEQKEYSTYMESLKYSAKLYVDSYGEDLFGRSKSGCTLIRYKDLVDKGLLKDIPIDEVSCNSEETFVKVVKMDSKYGYATSIGCGSVNADGSVSVDVKMPKTGLSSSDTCSVNTSTIMSFTAKPSADSSIKYRKRNIQLTISSDTGINNNMSVYYGFSYNKDTNVINNDWKALPVKLPGKKEQKEDILAGQTISITTDDLTTPTSVTGELYLVVRVDNLENLSGDKWSTSDAQKEPLYFGPYTVDNTKPVFNDSNVISSESGYNSIKPKLQLKVTDEKYSTTNDLRMCISYDEDKCSKKISDTRDNSKYEKYSASKVLTDIDKAYEGKTHTVYVTVADAAGNTETNSYNYTTAVQIDYNGNSGKGSMTPSYCNKNQDCSLKGNEFTKGGYQFDGWYTAATGGTKYNNTAKFSSKSTVYAHWKTANYSITYNLNGGSATGNPSSYTIETATFTLVNPTRSGYIFSGWTGSNGTTAQTSVKITKGSTGNKTYTANWTPANVEKTFTAQSGCASETYKVPYTGKYKIELWGAQGSGGGWDCYKFSCSSDGKRDVECAGYSNHGGKGGYVSGEIQLTAGEELIFTIGKTSNNTYLNRVNDPKNDKLVMVTGGCNGGGKGLTGWEPMTGAGGGASDVRYKGTDLKNRIMVAGGGGGAGGGCGGNDYSGGAGGNLTGGDGTASTTPSGKGGTQTGGGEPSSYIRTTNKAWGSFGNGGGADSYSGGTARPGPGGGGGYYGGGEGYHYAGAGGGSSFISGYTGCVAVGTNGNPKSNCNNNTTDNSCSVHFSGKVFTNGTMQAGVREGHGLGKITFIG